MVRSALVCAAGAVLAFAAFAGPAQAQLSEDGGPVSYSADNLEYFDAERRLVLTGDVDVVQGEARLRSDKLTLFFRSAPAGAAEATPPAGMGSGDIERMIAEGEVYYVTPQQSARGDHAVYDTASDQVTFTGNVVIASPDNIIRGNTLQMEIGSRRTTVRPGAGQRVRGVFTPQNDPNQGQQTPPG